MSKLAALAFALSSLALFAERDTAIYRGKLTSDLNANGNRITSVDSPLDPGDAANKEYVDAHGGGGCDTNAVDALANSAVVTNALTVATTNRVAALETATGNLSSSVAGLASSKADKVAPATSGNLAALTADGNLAESGISTNLILSLRGKQDLRIYVYGYGSRLSSDCLPVTLDGEVVSYSIGRSGYGEHDFPTLVINGEVLCTFTNEGVYDGGYDGLLFNGRSAVLGKYPYLDPASVVDFPPDRIARKSDIPSISATDPAFSNAVLAVQISTNDFAALYALKEAFADLPVDPVTGGISLGALLAALASAAAWLKKNKVDKLTVTGMTGEVTAESGIAKLDDFFTNSNSLLTATIDARLPYPLNAVTDETGLLKDRAINTTSLASVTVPDNFTDLLIRASVASSLAVTMPEAIATKYGDTFPGEAGEYLITITKTGAAEAYVRTIKLEEVA